MNYFIEVTVEPEDDHNWSVSVPNPTATRLNLNNDVTVRWVGADHRARAVRMLRAAADMIEGVGGG